MGAVNRRLPAERSLSCLPPHLILVADIESAIDWWMDAFLPLGALPPQRLQAAINAAYTAAEEQDGAAMAAERVLAAVPGAEAEVIRAELARIKLSGKRWWLWGGDRVRGGMRRHACWVGRCRDEVRGGMCRQACV